MEIQNHSTYEFVFKKPATTLKKFNDLSEEEQKLWITYCTKWTWRATECLIELKDFKPSMRTVAERLNITLEEAVEAVEGLEQLKLIRRTPNGSFARTSRYLALEDMGIDLNHILCGHLLFSTELGGRITDTENMRFRNSFFTCNRKKLAEALQKIEEIFKSLTNDVATDHDEVFAMALSCASVTKRSSRHTIDRSRRKDSQS